MKKLVLPDGSVLRAQLPGRPTRDCLFADPARDGTSLLKIWNLNKCTGVVGVFNCQGAGWCRIAKKTRIHDTAPGTLTGSVCASDVDLISKVVGPDWKGETIVYAYKSGTYFDHHFLPREKTMHQEYRLNCYLSPTGEVVRLPEGASIPVTLKVLEYELFHVCPLQVTSNIYIF